MNAQAALAVSENNSSKTGHIFQPGETGNKGGRPRGVPNKATREIKDFARRVLESKSYKRSLLRRLKEDRLAPAVETLLFYYAYGKPKETFKVEGEQRTNVLAILALMPDSELRKALTQAEDAEIVEAE